MYNSGDSGDTNHGFGETPSQPAKKSRKGHHELLTEEEKKANHIASEQKRRQNIKCGFELLVEKVPTLSQCHRSESLILQKCKTPFLHILVYMKNC